MSCDGSATPLVCCLSPTSLVGPTPLESSLRMKKNCRSYFAKKRRSRPGRKRMGVGRRTKPATSGPTVLIHSILKSTGAMLLICIWDLCPFTSVHKKKELCYQLSTFIVKCNLFKSACFLICFVVYRQQLYTCLLMYEGCLAFHPLRLYFHILFYVLVSTSLHLPLSSLHLLSESKPLQKQLCGLSFPTPAFAHRRGSSIHLFLTQWQK